MAEWDAGSDGAVPGGHGVAAGTGGVEGRAVEAAMAGIADLEDVPLAGHVARFDAVHRTLADALSAIDGN